MDPKMVKLDDNALDDISGGSIVFNGDHTTCGRNCNNQYYVLNDAAVQQYIAENCWNMSEKTMLSNMLSLGYLAAI